MTLPNVIHKTSDGVEVGMEYQIEGNPPPFTIERLDSRQDDGLENRTSSLRRASDVDISRASNQSKIETIEIQESYFQFKK